MLTFSPLQYFILILSLLILLFSIFTFFKGKEKLAVILLLIGALGLRLFMITIDPFLHDWDERFHALVAKNMMTYPFKPMLFVNPVLPYDYKAWCCNHIWVHKQPLFLWQMALSMKVFGVNEITLRLPSALMGAIQVYFVFRIGKLLRDSKAGFFGALFFAIAFYPLQLIAGVGDMDQIRVAFAFYVLASIWAFAEYYNSYKTYWTILIGLFAGCAVLNMWLPGLIVYGAWGTAFLFKMKFNLTRMFKDGWKEIMLIVLSLAIAVLIFLPWQIYISHAFPLESTYEAQWNSRHITEALENHEGSWYYYVLQMPLQFGKVFALLIPLGLFSLFGFSRNRLLLVALLFCLIVPYAFFSIIVQTRMPSYVYMSHFIIWLSFGLLVSGLSELPPLNKDFKFKSIIQTSFLFILCVLFVFKIDDILSNDLLQQAVGNIQSYREKKIHNTEIYKRLDQLVPPGYVVFNCNSFENVEAMFYSNRTVYNWFPNQKQYDSLKNLGIKIAAFESHEQYQLPEYIGRDTSIILIKDNLK